MLWQIADHDLATLDSAEGVPVRYRRDRLTVHTDDGPAEAWVYIDHRVEPGAPRPGYLERIIDAAQTPRAAKPLGRIPRRWDPAQLATQSGRAGYRLAPQSLSELLADPDVSSPAYCGRASGSWPSTAAGWSR